MVVEIIGRKVEADSNKVFVERNGDVYAFAKSVGALTTTTPIDQASYALIQEGDKATRAISMKQTYNGDNQRDTIVKVMRDGLTVPTAEIFMPHYKNANDALRGRSVLYDASGNLIEGERLDNYVNTLNRNCWVWLNGGFAKGSGFKGLDLVTISGLDKDGNPQFSKVPLEECLDKNCYAELGSINSQSFATQKASVQKFEPGETFYLEFPVQDAAVWFDAESVVTISDCSGDPQFSFPRLGVFTSAEGAQSQN